MAPKLNASKREGYHRFGTEDEPYGSFQVFYHGRKTLVDLRTEDGKRLPCGWYWWACFPGCLPDGEACGPFDTSEAAYQDAHAGDD